MTFCLLTLMVSSFGAFFYLTWCLLYFDLSVYSIDPLIYAYVPSDLVHYGFKMVLIPIRPRSHGDEDYSLGKQLIHGSQKGRKSQDGAPITCMSGEVVKATRQLFETRHASDKIH